MSTPGAGFEYPPVVVSWLKRDVLLFAYSIGCSSEDELHFLFELHPKFQVFPTYSIILGFKGKDNEVTDFYARLSSTTIPGIPKLDPRRMVDGQRSIIFHKPLPPTSAGRNFQIHKKVLGVYDKGKPGTVVETEDRIIDTDSGENYTTIISSAFYTGQGGWGGPRGGKGINYDPPAGRTPDVVGELQTTKETPHLYRLNGDYNPLHATPEPGAKMGFGGAILHGLFSWNAAARQVLHAFGGSDAKNLKEFQARFAAPVKPGDKLIFEMWKTGEVKNGFEDIRFTVRVEGGKVVLANGRALVNTAPKSSL